MTFFAALSGLFTSFWFALVGALLRWILRSHGGQLFHGAFVIGDIALWCALAIVVFFAVFGFIGDLIFAGELRRDRRARQLRRRRGF